MELLKISNGQSEFTNRNLFWFISLLVSLVNHNTFETIFCYFDFKLNFIHSKIILISIQNLVSTGLDFIFEKTDKSSDDFHDFFSSLLILFFSDKKLSLLSLFDIFIDHKKCAPSTLETRLSSFLFELKMLVINLLQSWYPEFQFVIFFFLFFDQFLFQFLHQIFVFFFPSDWLRFEDILSFRLVLTLLFSFLNNTKNLFLKLLRQLDSFSNREFL